MADVVAMASLSLVEFLMIRAFRLSAIACASLAVMSLVTAAGAATLTFNTDPFAGSTALATPGRQVVGNELFVPVFDLANDVLEFDLQAFNGPTGLNFANSFASSIPTGATFIALKDFDGDGDLTNGTLLNAGLAANLIAARITTQGAGFFLYRNSQLDAPRLVYSTDLDSATADLKILARFTGLSNQESLDFIRDFSVSNIAVTSVASVPEPATWGLMIGGFAVVGATLRQRRRAGLIA
jgi:hypothetical protein